MSNKVLLPPAIANVLRRTRRRLRLFAVARGAFGALAACLALAVLSFLFDYLLEPGITFRFWARIGLCAVVMGLWARLALAPAWARITDRSLALLLERGQPDLSDSLTTAVELTGRTQGFSNELFERTVAQAAARVESLAPHRVVRGRPVWRAGAVAGGLVAGLLALNLVWPGRAAIWWRRVALIEETRYPRATRLDLVGFDAPAKKVARGRDFELTVSADPQKIVPDRVRLRYRLLESGSRGTVQTIKVGRNLFRHTFPNLLESIEFFAQGGDDRTSTHRLEVVEPPVLERVVVRAEYPRYTGRSPRELTYSGTPLALPRGTRVAIELWANKPIEWLEATGPGGVLTATRAGASSFTLAAVIDENLPIAIALADTDGIALDRAQEIELEAAQDMPPVVEARLDGVSLAVTPTARVGVRVQVTDDFGIAELAFETAQAEQEPVITPIALAPMEPGGVDRRVEFDLEPLELEPGTRFTLAIVARDGKTPGGPGEGRSPAFTFEIVTPEELLSRLAMRELNLRQRFEQIVTDLRSTEQRLEDLRGQWESGLGPDLARLRLEQIAQECRKAGGETEGVGQAFHEILAELANNRIGALSLAERLETAIVQPLDDLLGVAFPRTEQALAELRESLGLAAAAEVAGRAGEQMSQLLERCERILRAMLKLESFQEAVTLLRAIIEDQTGLLEKTRARRRQQVRELLR